MRSKRATPAGSRTVFNAPALDAAKPSPPKMNEAFWPSMLSAQATAPTLAPGQATRPVTSP